MKSNFKYIIVFIIGTLFIVFLVQLFWLRGLYNSIEIKMEQDVIECLGIANSYELECRLDSVNDGPKGDGPKGEISISQSIGGSDEDTSEASKTMKRKRVVRSGDTVQSVKEEAADEEFSLAQFEKLGIMIREAMHQVLDTVAPIRLDTFYSALLPALEAKGIESSIYRIETMDMAKDSVMSSLRMAETDGYLFVSNYVYDSENQLGYRVHLEPLTKTVLSQMLGILVSTALIIVILAFAFWYLIRTIFQQKTLEEIKDDFTNNITHELKTPIAVAYSATDALLNFGLGDNKEKREKYLSINKEQLEKLSSLVEQILSMSMERRLKLILKKDNVRLKPLLEALVEQHRMKTDKGVVFDLDIQPDDLTICADKTHLHNVISNLIDNGIKYSKGEAVIEIHAYRDHKWNIIKVVDHGIGVAQDKQRFLFEKFYRVPQGNKHDAKGYGIGLFYVKTIIEKHGGTVNVASAVGKGSEFTIKIPIEDNGKD